MSQRMTEERVKELRGVDHLWDREEEDEICMELMRARRVEQEQAEELKRKGEQIQALADALEMLNGRMVTNYESHPGYHEIQNITNAERVMVRTALRLAGRL